MPTDPTPPADNPELDGTDAAHPAWWRGHDHTARVFCAVVNKILDGKDDGVDVNAEPWHATRRRLLALVAERAAAESGGGDVLKRMAEIAERAAKATPGPMYLQNRVDDPGHQVEWFWRNGEPRDTSLYWDSTLMEDRADADFYCHARDDIPWLLSLARSRPPASPQDAERVRLAQELAEAYEEYDRLTDVFESGKSVDARRAQGRLSIALEKFRAHTTAAGTGNEPFGAAKPSAGEEARLRSALEASYLRCANMMVGLDRAGPMWHMLWSVLADAAEALGDEAVQKLVDGLPEGHVLKLQGRR